LPTSLGAWHQNIYFSNPMDAPALCYGPTGERLTLPNAATGGAVGYSVNVEKNASISLYQYADQAAADAALAALRKLDCPDSTKVKTDVGTVVKADQGTDVTDASEAGVASMVTSRYGGGAGTTTVVEIRSTTQRELAVIQTEVILSGGATAWKTVNRAAEMNRRWHMQPLAAYAAFGSGNSR
jgi:hypothetical protein